VKLTASASEQRRNGIITTAADTAAKILDFMERFLSKIVYIFIITHIFMKIKPFPKKFSKCKKTIAKLTKT